MSVSTLHSDDLSQHCCPVCGCSSGSIHHAREMMLGTREVFRYFECGGCGCLSLVSIPEDLAKYYPQNYYSLRATALDGFRKLRDRLYLSHASFLVNWRARTDLDVIRRVRLTRRMSLLDVGCGSGHLLGTLRELGYNATGIDPSVSQDVEDRFGVRVERKTLDEVTGPYDVLLFRHSLEHMPLDSLRLARRLLKDHGTCVVCIPLVGWSWRHYGVDWVQLDAPRHLFLHSPRSFRSLASQSGFRVERVVFDSSAFQFWASASYQRDIPLHEASPPRLWQSLFLRWRATVLNWRELGDSAQFYLRPVS